MKRLMLLFAVVMVVAFASNARADSITLGVGPSGDRIIGEVIPTLLGQFGGQAERDALMLNNLLAMSLGTRTASGVNPEYYRSTNVFGVLPQATVTGAVTRNKDTFPGLTQTQTMVQVTLTVPYAYLVAAYDGPNSGVEAWYLGGLAAGTIVNIPRYAYPVPASGGDPGAVWPQNLVNGWSGTPRGSRYQMTGWTLFNPTTVPDGGTTAALLGLGMLGLGFLKRLRG